MRKKSSNKRLMPLPRPKTPCEAYYLLTGTPDSDPQDAKLLKVDWKGPSGVAAAVRLDGKEYHMGLDSIIPVNEETMQLVHELRRRIIEAYDAGERAKELRKKLRKRSLAAILESERW